MSALTRLDGIAHQWTSEVVDVLHDYIAIPALSPMFDETWADTGHLERAVALLRDWAASRDLPDMSVTVHQLDGRTPLIVCEIPAHGVIPIAEQATSIPDTVLLYGHLDKQPEMTGWRHDLGPWKPVLDGERLYGRGGADDGYALFCALTAIEAVRAGGGAHHRCVVLIEASEESGSPDLMAHVDALADVIGTPSLVVCLDSGALDYERLWVTTSLRGLAGGTLRVDILDEGVHSGSASGVVPSSFRIVRQLLDRVEDSATGAVLVDACHTPIPEHRVVEAQRTATEVRPIAAEFPFVSGARPMTDDAVEQILNRTWRPTLSVTGADGLPANAIAGNVLRPYTSVRLSFRLPPTVDADDALAALQRALTDDPPYGAHVELLAGEAASGWHGPAFAPWLHEALSAASHASFGQDYRAFGEGGTIPFMRMLQLRFTEAQFFVTGVLGPQSNAHGPNEFLHLPTAYRVTQSVANVLMAHAAR
jgi:acetylornithine deacetylase/succinyl-diaminopimelate desuccinylase-like protein